MGLTITLGIVAFMTDSLGEGHGLIALPVVALPLVATTLSNIIQVLSKKYRGKNATTDVLSFEDLNEIYICLPQAKRQAKLLKTSEKAELTRLLVHGIVHLKGHDHEKSAKEAEKMRQIEEGILKNLER